MLSRLDVRQKLGLLLMLPLIAVVCSIVPFTVERVDNARAAAATLRMATDARDLGAVVQGLQRERVLALGYLLLPSVDRGELLGAQQAVDDDVRLARAAGPSTALGKALDGLAQLGEPRRAVLARSADAASVYRAYHDAIQALLDALNLTRDPGIDAPGLRQLDTLDVLLPANEQASEAGAALVIAATDPAAGVPLLTAALATGAEQRARFGRLATDQQIALLEQVESGAAGTRVSSLADSLTSTRSLPAGTGLAAVLAVAQSYSQLRQVIEDSIVADIADSAGARATSSAIAAAGVGGSALVVLAIVVGMSVRVSRSIAAPLRRLSLAAGAVADIAGAELVRVDDSDEVAAGHARLAAVNIRTQDELGELAAAINRVQAIAALMLERQVSTRRNVAVMFANIARRTQSLVVRQLALIDDMERDEQDARALERLYRLDHLTTRLRRSADSLLVVSGNRDDALDVPTPLLEVIRAATGEIEGFQAVRLGDVPEVLVAIELASDLRLLLAELLENATSFSPPGVPVEVSAELADGCRITVLDNGVGMSPNRLAEENKRLLERPRLDVAPTDVLGLFVVGRLARRHGLTVRLNASPGRGVTATITIPPSLFAAPRRVTGSPARPPLALPMPPTMPFVGPNDPSFTWFVAGTDRYETVGGQVPPAAPPTPPPPVAPPPLAAPVTPSSRNGLNRRIPNQFLAAFDDGVPAVGVPRGAVPEPRDAAAEAAELDAFAEGTVRALAEGRQASRPGPAHAAVRGVAPAPPGSVPQGSVPPVAAPPSRHGLTRRTPGAHLAPSARPAMPEPAMPPVTPRRDPEFERDSIEQFVEGLARAAHGRSDHDPR